MRASISTKTLAYAVACCIAAFVAGSVGCFLNRGANFLVEPHASFLLITLTILVFLDIEIAAGMGLAVGVGHYRASIWLANEHVLSDKPTNTKVLFDIYVYAAQLSIVAGILLFASQCNEHNRRKKANDPPNKAPKSVADV